MPREKPCAWVALASAHQGERFTIYGPFSKEDEAREYASTEWAREHGYRGWTIAPLWQPDGPPEARSEE